MVMTLKYEVNMKDMWQKYEKNMKHICKHIEDACGVSSPHPSTPCQEQVEFTAEMVADRCETTAEKQALSAECCKHFRREFCLLLPLLLPLPAGTMQRKRPKVMENLYYVFVILLIFVIF